MGKFYSSDLHKSKLQLQKTILGTLIAVVGLVGGTVLVSQPQLLGSRAIIRVYTHTPTPLPTSTGTINECPSGYSCSSSPAEGGFKCRARSGQSYAYCCPDGQDLIGGKCTHYRACGEGLYCKDNIRPQGATACVSGNTRWFCCPKGQIIKNYKCVVPFHTPVPSGQPTPDICDQKWIDGKCGEGNCAKYQRYQFRIVPQGCGKATRCLLDLSCVAK